MSKRKKKLRNPSPEAMATLEQERRERLSKEEAERAAQQSAQDEDARKQAEWDALSDAEREARLDASCLEGMSPEQRRAWCEAGERLYGSLTTVMPTPDGPLTADEVRGSLDTCTRFLTRLADTAMSILECLDPNSLRKIIAADVPLSEHARMMLKAAGHGLYEEVVAQPAEETPKDSSPQKRPRGSRHPLMAFFSLAVQASRLVQQISRGLWPHVHNQKTLAEKEEARRDRQSYRTSAIHGIEKLQQKHSGAN